MHHSGSGSTSVVRRKPRGGAAPDSNDVQGFTLIPQLCARHTIISPRCTLLQQTTKCNNNNNSIYIIAIIITKSNQYLIALHGFGADLRFLLFKGLIAFNKPVSFVCKTDTNRLC